jgi:hypothetical protein
MVLTWRDPPADRRPIFSETVLAELRANPGRWAVLREYPNRTAIKGNANAFKHPADIEIKGVLEAPGSVLYARAKTKGK